MFKILKILSVACILSATVGFGHHMLVFNNQISDLDGRIYELNFKLEKKIKSFDRFTIAEIRSILKQVHHDVILAGGGPAKKDNALVMTHESSLASQRVALASWASSVSSEYMKEIQSKVKTMDWEEMQNTKVEMLPKLQKVIDRIKMVKQESEQKKISVVKNRDRRNMIYLGLQLFGIVFGVIGEVVRKER